MNFIILRWERDQISWRSLYLGSGHKYLDSRGYPPTKFHIRISLCTICFLNYLYLCKFGGKYPRLRGCWRTPICWSAWNGSMCGETIQLYQHHLTLHQIIVTPSENWSRTYHREGIMVVSLREMSHKFAILSRYEGEENSTPSYEWLYAGFHTLF